MSTELLDEPSVAMQKLIEEYLHDQGYSSKKLKELPERVVKQLMREATRYATIKMQEIKTSVTEIQKGTLHHN